jgi:hypothetical protein
LGGNAGLFGRGAVISKQKCYACSRGCARACVVDDMRDGRPPPLPPSKAEKPHTCKQGNCR